METWKQSATIHRFGGKGSDINVQVFAHAQ